MLYDPKDLPALKAWWAKDQYDRQRAFQMRRDAERQGIKSMNDPRIILQNAKTNTAKIVSDLKAKIKSLDDNHLIPEQGRAIEKQRAHDEARTALRQLKEQVELAGVRQRVNLLTNRENSKPKPDPATVERFARQINRMADAGIPLDEIVDEFSGNAAALFTLEGEIRPLARSLRPNDKDAAQGFEDVIHDHALRVYGEAYRAAHEALEAHDKAVYFANMNLKTAEDAVNGRDANPVFADPGQSWEAINS